MKRVINAIRRKVQTLQEEIISWGEGVTPTCGSASGLMRNGCSTMDNIHNDDDDMKNLNGNAYTNDFVASDSSWDINNSDNNDAMPWESMTAEEKELQNRILDRLGKNCECKECHSRRHARGNSAAGANNNAKDEIISVSNTKKDRSVSFPVREITPIQHICQTETWDCGLACVQMILQWLRQNDFENEECHNKVDKANDEDTLHIEKRWIFDFVGTESIWTIDLVMLLDHILQGEGSALKAREGDDNVDENSKFPNQPAKSTEQDDFQTLFNPNQQPCHHQLLPLSPTTASFTSYLFCSTKLGVDESYNKLGYYKDAFSCDELRVKQLFDTAHQKELPLMQLSHLSLKVLVDFVSRRGFVAIVLLDNRVLKGGVHHGKNTIEVAGGSVSNNDNMLAGDDDTDPISAASPFSCLRGDDINRTDSNMTTASTASIDKSYAGHYVILCGISQYEKNIRDARNHSPGDSSDKHNFCMIIKNPGNWRLSEYVTPTRFERSWRANGTDEDVILIARHDS